MRFYDIEKFDYEGFDCFLIIEIYAFKIQSYYLFGYSERQSYGVKIVEEIIVELFSDELNRETMVCTNCKKGFHPLVGVLILSDTVKQWDMRCTTS
ncbi:MAG: hypothetical protein WAV32_00235 [Halobacteriota archaeon]